MKNQISSAIPRIFLTIFFCFSDSSAAVVSKFSRCLGGFSGGTRFRGGTGGGSSSPSSLSTFRLFDSSNRERKTALSGNQSK